MAIDSTSAAKMNVTLYDGNQAVKNSSYLTLHNYSKNIAYLYSLPLIDLSAVFSRVTADLSSSVKH